MKSFHAAQSTAVQWLEAAQDCLDQLGEGTGATVGFLYVTDLWANRLNDFVAFFREHLPVQHWVGSVGVGIVANGREYVDEPAVAVMLAALPLEQFAVLSPVSRAEDIGPALAKLHVRQFGLIHGDPRTAHIGALVSSLEASLDGMAVGGLTSARSHGYQLADAVSAGGLSGLITGPGVMVARALTQGVSPIGPVHVVTASNGPVISEIDERPALDVLLEDIGEILARDLQRAAGYIFAGFPVNGADTKGDYLVRNLVGVDMQRRLIAVGEQASEGRQIMFCRRDGMSARQDMERMLEELAEDCPEPPRGGIYYSCLGRGANLFGEAGEEIQMIHRRLGAFPLTGFYANGEIFGGRLYGYTGVLALFR